MGRTDKMKAVSAALTLTAASASSSGRWNGSPKLTREKIPNGHLRAHQKLNVADLPADHDWRNVNGTNYLTESRNQHIPQYCGSCWAFGTLSSLNDRLKIANKGAYPEVILAPQVLINCGGGGSCEGGNVGGVFDYMEEFGLPDETCQNYEAADNLNPCDSNKNAGGGTGICETCSPGPKGPGDPGTCTAIKDPQLWTLESYGYVLSGGDDTALDASGALVSNADRLKAEIYANGPLACGIHATPELEAFGTTTPVSDYPGGIYNQSVFFPMPNHILSITGWGHDAALNKDYWIVRNSWGTYWGEDGYMKINMGGHNLGIESSCSWATPAPKKSTVPNTKLKEVRTEDAPLFSVNDEVKPGTYFDYENAPRPVDRSGSTAETHVVSPLPRFEDAPASFDIRNIDGVNYASPSRNQHIPQYCGSCWTHGPTSALNDRFQLARKNAFPKVFLAPQQLINCMPPPADKTQGDGGCLGGDPAEVGPWGAKHGFVHETCQNYQAKNLYKDFKCDAIGECRNCDPEKGCYAMGAPAPWQKSAPATSNAFDRYYPDEYGRINSTDYGANLKQMVAEIGGRGPIACAVCVTPAFEAYSGGIFEDTTNCTTLDHSISIAGYGHDEKTGKDYWIGRNSWGTYWGEDGWFRIVKGSNNLGVEKDCAWMTPKL